MIVNILTRRPRGVALLCASIALAGSAGAAMAQAAPSGEALFRQRCASCHTVQPGVNRLGPSLHGVMGRRAGAVQGYNYSPALREWGQSWTAENMDRYLTNTRQAVPGTKMTIAAPAPAQRQAIIAYLQTQR